MKKIKILMLVASISLLWACSENKNKLTPFAEPQEYVGNIPFDNSQNVQLHFILSANVEQITKLELTADELYMLPEADGIKNVIFRGGITKDSIDLKNSKILLDEPPLLLDMTVTNACIYGNVKFQLDDGATKSVYAVFKNTTTPQEIPEDITNKISND
ncbi:MAG: hypothetical protein LBS69_05420 [Prevotellaceae bacterium]|jgi:hypothetical protein|nr:hypothetical protein [Prevotellaceae bacterium]